jgi:hypothetical protein
MALLRLKAAAEPLGVRLDTGVTFHTVAELSDLLALCDYVREGNRRARLRARGGSVLGKGVPHSCSAEIDPSGCAPGPKGCFLGHRQRRRSTLAHQGRSPNGWLASPSNRTCDGSVTAECPLIT